MKSILWACILSMNLPACWATHTPASPSMSGKPSLKPGQLRITFIANDGFLLQSSTQSVLIDALFNAGYGAYRVPSASLRDQMIQGQEPFGHVDLLLVTHNHGDHIYGPYVRDFLQHHPETVFGSAAQVVDALGLNSDPLRDRLVRLDLRVGQSTQQEWAGIPTQVTRMRHMNDDSGNNPHSVVYLLDLDGIKILHPGDTTLKFNLPLYEGLHLEQEQIDILILEYFGVSEETQAFVSNVIKPKVILPKHFSIASMEDDIKKFQDVYPQSVVLSKPLDSFIYDPNQYQPD